MAHTWIKRTLTAAAAAVLLAACQSAALPEGVPATDSVLRSGAQVLAQVKEKTNEPDLYFSAEGQYYSEPQKGGYFRRVLGKTADGSWVVQDFYQDNKAKQIDPALIFHPEGLRNFDNDVVQGRVVWYRKDGSLMQSIVFERGVAHGWESHYDRQGRLRWLIGIDKGKADGRGLAYDEAGRLIYREAKGERELWHGNGRLAVKVRLPSPENSHGGSVVIEGWDEQGKALTTQQAQHLADYLMSRIYNVQGED